MLPVSSLGDGHERKTIDAMRLQTYEFGYATINYHAHAATKFMDCPSVLGHVTFFWMCSLTFTMDYR